MRGKIRSFLIVIPVVLVLILSGSWLALAASDLPSPRDNPEFWDKLSSVVVINPTITTQSFLQTPYSPFTLDSAFKVLGDVPVGPNILCNQDQTTKAQNEPSIDVNPSDPNHLVASSNDYRLRVNPPPEGDVRPGYYVSFDGGITWPGDGIIDISTIPNTFAAGDPAIAIHDANNVYYSYIAFNRTVDDAGGLAVSKSTDGGITWQPPVVVAWNTLTIFHDKEYIATDATGSAYDGNLYVSWTRFQYDSPIFFSRSTDGGSSFSTPFAISDSSLSSNQGSIPVVGPDGEVYVAWYNFNQDSIRLNKSTNGGSSFGTPRLVANITSVPSPLPGGEFRSYSFPTMAVDQNNGYVYVAWSDFRNGDADIYFTSSMDGGSTWSTPVRVNDDTKFNDAHQFFPWMDVSPNGKLYIGWFDSRLDPTPTTPPLLYDMYVTVSTDGGLTFSPNQRISEVTSDSSVGGFTTPFIGDYSGLAATDEIVFPAWVDTRRNQQDLFTQQKLSVQGQKLSPAWVEQFQPFPYSIILNSNTNVSNNQVNDPLPAGLLYVPDSAWASSGNVSFTDNEITWYGDILSGIPISITFEVTPTVPSCLPITNTAVLTTGLGLNVDLFATSLVTGSVPGPDFSWVDSGLVFTFTNETSGTPPLTYVWDFGDGITSTEVSPVHEYTFPGNYPVTLTATDLCGSDAKSHSVDATCAPPLAGFTWLGNELNITFTNQSKGRFSLSYLWNFGDGVTSTLTSPVHDYHSPGVFNVSMTATDLCGIDTIVEPVTTTCSAPAAQFSWMTDGMLVSFTDLSNGTTPFEYLWDFGDGITSTEQSPSHLYTSPGIYPVILTLNAPCGIDIFEAKVRAGSVIFMPVTFRH